MTNEGWQCPKCGRVWGPIVVECGPCNKDAQERIRRIYGTCEATTAQSVGFGPQPKEET